MPDICWATHSATSDHSRQFLDIVDDINCFQLVDVSTHGNGNSLDLFLDLITLIFFCPGK